jgi:epoxyqueuosine reductase
VQSDMVRRLARECGFELAGVARAEPLAGDFERYQDWVAQDMAGEMGYLTDRRAEVRRDPRNLSPGARSIICVGKLYNQAAPPVQEGRAIFSRYAWGKDYHDVMREALELFAHRLSAVESHQWKVCVDTAPLLERSYARQAGLGWIGRNTCLINEPLGSWFFLGEVITTLELEPDSPPPDRCGTCTRCIEACPTQAIVPDGDGWKLDARRCIAYLNIELRGPIPEGQRTWLGSHVFGCDICQDVCPWNARAPQTTEPAFQPLYDPAPPLEELAALSADDFRHRFRGTAVMRAKHEGLLRSVAAALSTVAREPGSVDFQE